MSRYQEHPLDRQGLQVGDRVQVLANAVRVPVGLAGAIVGFTAGSQHPLVEIANRGRFLIPALSLARQDPLEAYSPPSSETRDGAAWIGVQVADPVVLEIPH